MCVYVSLCVKEHSFHMASGPRNLSFFVLAVVPATLLSALFFVLFLGYSEKSPRIPTLLIFTIALRNMNSVSKFGKSKPTQLRITGNKSQPLPLVFFYLSVYMCVPFLCNFSYCIQLSSSDYRRKFSDSFSFTCLMCHF